MESPQKKSMKLCISQNFENYRQIFLKANLENGYNFAFQFALCSNFMMFLFIYFCILWCVHMIGRGHICSEARGRRWMSCSITLHPIPLRRFPSRARFPSTSCTDSVPVSQNHAQVFVCAADSNSGLCACTGSTFTHGAISSVCL